MDAVLISISPKWCELIASGKKTIEVRKTAPKLKTPFNCFVYCTKPRFEHEDFFVLDTGAERVRTFYGGGKVIGEFVCDRVFDIEYEEDEGYNDSYTPRGFSDCLSDEQFDGYLRGKNGYGWHISELVIYDEPKKLSEFTGLRKTKFGYAPYEIKRPPQSWMYVQEVGD